MDTRIARYCDRVMEAGWLAAVILTPLFFNIYSSRVFEPDKLTLLRSIAILMGVAWLIRRLEQGGGALAGAREAGDDEPMSFAAFRRSLVATPLMPQVLLLVVVYLVASALSVAPRISLWGSYQRLQGTYTTMAYIVIFFVAWQGLRRRDQLERLLNVITLTSLPVALYGVLQHYGLDPLPWAGSVTDRVTGNLGNAIFLAAFLIMAFFVTLERAVSRFRRLLGEERSSLADAMAGGIYLFILALQLLAIYFTKSRGPWLGILAGIYVFALISLVAMRRSAADRGPLSLRDAGKAAAVALLSPLAGVVPAYLALILARRGRRWLWLSWCIQSLVAIAFLVVFNMPHSPLAPLRNVPGLGRLGQIFETESGTGRVRVLIWEGAVNMLKSNPARALIGYGPESMYVAYNPFYPPDLAHYESRFASPDRSHNETFDALVSTGVVGFLIYIALFIGIFLHGLRWLGFLPAGEDGRRSRQRTLFLGLVIGGAILGILVPLALDHSLRFAGVGIPAGLIVGMAFFLGISAFAPPPEAPASFGSRELVLVSMLAMIVAHFVEIHFGIAIAATRVYFWLGLAVLLALGSKRLSLERDPKETAPAARPAALALSSQRRKRRRREAPAPIRTEERAAGPLTGAVTSGLIGALILGTLFYDYITNTSGDADPLRVLWLTLASIRLPDRPPVFSPGTLSLFLLTWLLGAILVIGEAENAERPPERNWWRPALACYLGISLLGALAYALFHTSQLTGKDLGLLIIYYYVFVAALVLLVAAFLPGQRVVGASWWRKSRAWSYPLLAAAVALLALGNATIVRADIYYKQAWDGFHQRAAGGLSSRSMDRPTAQRYYDAALYYYDQALRLAPAEDYYLLFFGKAFLERAEITDDARTQEQYLLRGEEVLQRARRLNPLNTDHSANLARLNRTWAGVSKDDATRRQKLALAVQYYEEANKLSPHNAQILDEWGQTLLDMGQPEQALARYQQSLALDALFSQTYILLGDYYARQENLEQARTYYEKATALDPGSAQIHSTLGYLYSRMGKLTEAISENLTVLSLYPQDYPTLKNLAILYSQVGKVQDALATATSARQLAPDADKAALDQMIAQLQATLQEPKP